jgi:hypothetical protein
MKTVSQAYRFADFWDAWPNTDRKQDRKKCLAKWQARHLDDIANEIIAHVLACRDCEKWRNGYEPLPATYLNNDRWTEPVPPPRPEAKPEWMRRNEAEVAKWLPKAGNIIEMETPNADAKRLG